MGDNQTRSRTVAGGDVVDQWSSTVTSGIFEMTIESLDPGGCSVAVDVVSTTADGSLETFTEIEVGPVDPLPSGPHHFAVPGVTSASVVLRANPLSDSDAGTCPVTYTFKWAG